VDELTSIEHRFAIQTTRIVVLGPEVVTNFFDGSLQEELHKCVITFTIE